MKTVLLFPPAGNFSQPYTSLPALTGFLRRAGHTVIQRDLAIEAVEDLVSGPRLRVAAERVEARLAGLLALPIRTEEAEAEVAALTHVSAFAPYVVEHIDEAKAVLRDIAEVTGRAAWARQLVERGMELLSAEYWPSVWNAAVFTMPAVGVDIGKILDHIADPQGNMFYEYFEQVIAPSILAEQPDLVGISCSYFGQVMASLTLAQLLKQRVPDLPICLGGAVIAHLAAVLQTEPRVFGLVDAIVVGEGEHALLALLDVIAGRRQLADVPNLMFSDGGQIRTTELYVEDVNALPTPDYAGLPLHLYLAPEITFLLPTDRGCYWHRCAFCVISSGMHFRYRPRRMELVIEDMQQLNRQFGARCFFLSNDAVPPHRMRALAEAIRDGQLGFLWQTETRLEKNMTPELCRVLSDGGCRRLMVGIEAGSQRILDLMHKGTRATELPRLVRNCAEADIAVHAFLLAGFPTETLDEARETIAFVEQHAAWVMSLTYQVFSLFPGSQVYADPLAYGVTGWEPPPRGRLDLTCEIVQVAAGMNRQDIEKTLLPEAYKRIARCYSLVRFTQRVISACQVPAFDDFDRSYLPWLAHHGVRSYRDALPAPGAPARSHPLALRPRIYDAVLQIEPETHWRDGNRIAVTLFSGRSGRALSLPHGAAEVLERYDGRSTVAQIAERLAAESGSGQFLRRYYEIASLSERLIEEGFLCAVEATEG